MAKSRFHLYMGNIAYKLPQCICLTKAIHHLGSQDLGSDGLLVFLGVERSRDAIRSSMCARLGDDSSVSADREVGGGTNLLYRSELARYELS